VASAADVPSKMRRLNIGVLSLMNASVAYADRDATSMRLQGRRPPPSAMAAATFEAT